jgi:hypothetical protein
MTWTGHRKWWGKTKMCTIFTSGNLKGKNPHGRNNVKIALKKAGLEHVDWIYLAQDRNCLLSLVNKS